MKPPMILISKQNVSFLLNQFETRLHPLDKEGKETVILDKYYTFGHELSNGNAYPNYNLLLQINKQLYDSTDYDSVYSYLRMYLVMREGKKRIRIDFSQKEDFENSIFIYSVDVQQLTAVDTTTGFCNNPIGVGGRASNYHYKFGDKNSKFWNEESKFDIAVTNEWGNTRFRKYDVCKLVVGFNINQKKNHHLIDQYFEFYRNKSVKIC